MPYGKFNPYSKDKSKAAPKADAAAAAAEMLDLLKGDKGDQGDPGPKGDKGDPGRDGRMGPSAVPGQDGERGDPGVDGKDGKDGKPGLRGERGLRGEKGVKGDKGKDGKAGKDGKDGVGGDSFGGAPPNLHIAAGSATKVLVDGVRRPVKEINFDTAAGISVVETAHRVTIGADAVGGSGDADAHIADADDAHDASSISFADNEDLFSATNVEDVIPEVFIATSAAVDASVAFHAGGVDPHTGYLLESLLDAKGDIISASAADTPIKLTVGANDTILMADSAAASGLKWIAPVVPTTQAFADSPTEGSGDSFTRGGHKHGMPANPVTAHTDTDGAPSSLHHTLGTGANQAAAGNDSRLGEAATHVADTGAAHAASAIAFTPNGSIAATDVQAAIQEVRDEATGTTWTANVNESGTSFTNFTAGTGTWSSDGTNIIQTDTATAFAEARFNTMLMTGLPLIVEVEMRFPTTGAGVGGARIGGLIMNYDGTDATGGQGVRIDEGADGLVWEAIGVTSTRTIAFTGVKDTWYKLRVIRGSQYSTVYIDGVLKGTSYIGNVVIDGPGDYVGLYTYGTRVDFRNYKVWTLSGSVPA